MRDGIPLFLIIAACVPRFSTERKEKSVWRLTLRLLEEVGYMYVTYYSYDDSAYSMSMITLHTVSP